MDLNLYATRDPTKSPRAAVWQHDTANAMNPVTLLMAHEEERGVLPVASDMDPFLVGSRGMPIEQPLPPDQVELLKWCIDSIESILLEPKAVGWTGRWLDVLKYRHIPMEGHKYGRLKVPEFGFGDKKSYDIIRGVVHTMRKTGAVRHGAECFNYWFPQALDEEFLIVWDGFEQGEQQPSNALMNTFHKPAPWRYANEAELRKFLLDRVDDGYYFPLNPKWVLCDPGWKEVYDKLLANPVASEMLEKWLPSESGVRERIREISEAYPECFTPLAGEEGVDCEDIDFDAAEWELRRHEVLRRARVKLRAFVRLTGAVAVRAKRANAGAGGGA
jgi:hypothetical protein